MDTGQRTRMNHPSVGDTGQRHVAHPPPQSVAVPYNGPDPDNGRDDGQRTRPYSNEGKDDQRDGQHRTYGVGHPGETTGQTSHPAKGLGFVGNKSGGETAMNVPNAPKGSDTPPDTTIPGGRR